MIFILTLTVRKILSEKKCGGTGLLSEKTEALHAELKKVAEASSSSYFPAVDL